MIPILLTFISFLLSLTAALAAGDASLYSSAFCTNNKQHSRISVRHIECGGIGYNQGYTTLEGFFAPHPESCSVMPFLDARGHVFDNGKVAANLGIGCRSIVGCRTYGLNLYYDYRNTKQLSYNQLSCGLETLGTLWDFRINGYFPLGKTATCLYDAKFKEFSGHHMIISQKYNVAMEGTNAELGFHFGKCRCVEFYAAAGAYHFAGKNGPKMWGGKGRLIASFDKYWTVELSNSYDKVFHNRFQGQLTFTVPFGSESKSSQTNLNNSCNAADVLFCRMVQPVMREEIVVVADRKKCSPAINPATDTPYNFIFVDNTSNSQGTYESPYPTLALAQAHSKSGDIIYVYPGDGTTKGMNSGIVLKSYQKFWGSGIDHSLTAAQGTFVIPAQSSTAPTITNTGSDCITLASINQVSGFTINNVIEGNSIFGTNLSNISIDNCTIDTTNEFDLVHLEYSGPSCIANINNLVLKNSNVDAIFINSTATTSTCIINNCTIQNSTRYAVNATFAHQATASFTNNSIVSNTNGAIFNFEGTSTLTASNNTLNNTTSVSSPPLITTAKTSPLTATISNNTINNNTCSALYFILNDTNTATLNISNNIITNNNTGTTASLGSPIVINPNNTTSGNCHVTLTDNLLSGNEGSCVYLSNGGYNSFTMNATGNTCDNNGGGFVFDNPCTTFKLTATNNSILNGRDHGITTTRTLNSADITISNNTITGGTNQASGIALSNDGTTLNLIVKNNTLSNNEGSGIIMYGANPITNVTVDIENNTINNNQNAGTNAAGGIDIEQFTNLSGTILNNTLLNNTNYGLYTGSTDASPAACVTMSGNTTNTDYALDSGAGVFNLAPCNVDAVNTGTITTFGTITTVQSCPDASPCS